MKIKFKQQFILFLLIFVLGLIIIYSEISYWHFSVVSRIVLLRLLNYWNWEQIYTARCLIPKTSTQHHSSVYNYAEFLGEDCLPCENLANNGIHYVQNLQFKKFQNLYLLQGLPIVVNDSKNEWQSDKKSCIKLLQNIYNNVESNPCNLQTNIVLNKHTTFAQILKTIEYWIDETETISENWFVHFRNCELQDIKVSRSISHNPYFYAALEQPHSSWLLLSNNYSTKHSKTLNLIDLVIVQQLKGTLQIILEAKNGCSEYCGLHSVSITQGQALVFMSKLWNFKYFPTNMSFSLSFITETYFD